MAGLVAIASLWTLQQRKRKLFFGETRLETYHGDSTSSYVTQYSSSLFRFDFSVYPTYGWASAVINFLSGGGARDLSGYSQFEFLMRGYNSGTTGNQGVMAVEFKDANGYIATKYPIAGIYDDEFQSVVINRGELAAANPNVNWNQIKEIALVVNRSSVHYTSFNGWLRSRRAVFIFRRPLLQAKRLRLPTRSVFLEIRNLQWSILPEPW
jgi:hypothetical protein